MTCLALATPAVAQEGTAPARGGVVDKVLACRALTASDARLACFDRETAVLDTSVRERSVAVIDQADVAKTKRTLFGIALPRITLFDKTATPEIKEVTAVVKSVSQGEGGRLVFTLEDGAVWAQTDDYPLFRSVRPGQKVTLKRGALGSYFAAFEKSVSVRAKRLR